jgi:hypothetical protein
MRRPGTKREAGDLDFWRRKRRRAKPQDNQGEGPMPVQWTAHIPQAMQRHGGSIKPEVEAACDEAMDRFLRGLRQAEPRQPDSRTDEPRR